MITKPNATCAELVGPPATAEPPRLLALPSPRDLEGKGNFREFLDDAALSAEDFVVSYAPHA